MMNVNAKIKAANNTLHLEEFSRDVLTRDSVFSVSVVWVSFSRYGFRFIDEITSSITKFALSRYMLLERFSALSAGYKSAYSRLTSFSHSACNSTSTMFRAIFFYTSIFMGAPLKYLSASVAFQGVIGHLSIFFRMCFSMLVVAFHAAKNSAPCRKGEIRTAVFTFSPRGIHDYSPCRAYHYNILGVQIF